jgi:hypothetical protein
MADVGWSFCNHADLATSRMARPEILAWGYCLRGVDFSISNNEALRTQSLEIRIKLRCSGSRICIVHIVAEILDPSCNAPQAPISMITDVLPRII